MQKCLAVLCLIIVFMILPATASIRATVSESSLSLQTEIEQLLQEEPGLNGGLVGISIRSAQTGKVLYDYNGSIRMRPASNMKLLTSAVALAVLGEDYRFKTEVRVHGERDGTKLKGNLYLKGFGDPTLLREDLAEMAKKVAESGITVIEGDLIGDDSWYDDVRLSPDLVWSDESTYYGSQISALTVSPDQDFDSGTIGLEIAPGLKVGEPARIKLSHDTDIVSVINQTVTQSPEGEADLTIHRKHGSNTIVVSGFLPIGSHVEKEWVAVWEPSQLALDLFEQELIKYGVQLSGASKVGVTPKDASVIIVRKSIPLSELLIPFMKLSNNGHAEVLIKEMGKVRKGEGSWEKGLEVVNEELPGLGVNPEATVIRDGSGISHVNLIPANEMSKLLFQVQKEKWFPSFMKSLPVAGHSAKMEGGTLRTRMEDLNVKAKTGTLTTVTSISGYVETKKGDTRIFSILLNNLLDEDKGKEVEDKVVRVIANN